MLSGKSSTVGSQCSTNDNCAREWECPVAAVDVVLFKGFRKQMEDAVVCIPNLHSQGTTIGEAGLCGDVSDSSSFFRNGLEDECIRRLDSRSSSESTTQSHSYFAVFDGHGGDEAARFLRGNFHEMLSAHPALNDSPRVALTETFMSANEEFVNSDACVAEGVGSTAVVALVAQNKLTVAWAGDSGAVLFRNLCVKVKDRVVPLTDDHFPLRRDEKTRIEKNGGYVVSNGCYEMKNKGWKVSTPGRVNGILAVSRAFGNTHLKGIVTCEPDVTEVTLDGTAAFMVLASDGLWDVMTPADVQAEVRRYVARQNERVYPDPTLLSQGASRHLAKLAIQRESSDNVSCLVIFFDTFDGFPSNDSHHSFPLLPLNTEFFIKSTGSGGIRMPRPSRTPKNVSVLGPTIHKKFVTAAQSASRRLRRRFSMLKGE